MAADACAAFDKVDLAGRRWAAEDVHALSLANLAGEYAAIATAEALVAAAARGGRRDASA